jgi:putative ABC transport system ATP-binding protein
VNKNTVRNDDVIIAEELSLNLPSQDGAVDIIRNITFSIPKGKRIAITGPSGSGKTSLLMLLAGLERPSAGSLVVQNTPIHNKNDDGLTEFRNQHVGIVFQEFHLMPTMTALENVALPLELRGKDSDIYAQATAMLQSVELGHRLHHYPSQLSGGEQQRTAIARACITTPDIMLADEPTGNLDQATGQLIIDVLFAMQQKQASTLLLITHDERLAARCDMQIHMRDGIIERISEPRA